MLPPAPARIHLLPAKASPYVVVLRRKPSDCFHVIRWNTRTDAFEHGSWFDGKLYAMRSDVSFDGQWMIYLALGANGNTWNGICRLPFLRTVAEGENTGTYFGGGYWSDAYTLNLNGWSSNGSDVPFKLAPAEPTFDGHDLGIQYAKWQRDGWQRRGPNFGATSKVENARQYTVRCDGDDGWQHQPSRQHPALVARYLRYGERGHAFGFSLDGYEALLDESVSSACWDSLGNLVFARLGILYKYSLADLKRGQPGTVHDLEPLTRSSQSG